MFFKRKKNISTLEAKFSREELLRRSRILIIDDEKPELIEDLQQAGFAVDYQADITNANMVMIDRPKYDLIILDFGSVGKTFGSDEGLSLLKHIKRVNPAAVVFAYTSKALSIEHADFYRLADGTLRKDAGIGESLDKIEDGLRQAQTVQNVWKGFLNSLGVKSGSSEDHELQDLFVRGLSDRGKLQKLRARIAQIAGSESGQQVGLFVLEKLLEIGVRAYVGA